MVNITLNEVGVTLGRRAVVHGVSAAFGAGTLTGIVGPNGAGKSTPARALLALVLASGRVEVDGRSEEHKFELQSLMRISYGVLCLEKKKRNSNNQRVPP